jgi:type IV secretory pathway VirB2 component (pilin)
MMQLIRMFLSLMSRLFGSTRRRLAAVVLAAQGLSLYAVSAASAAVKIEAKDFVEPFETQFGELVGPIVGLVALVTVVVWGINFLRKRAKAAG